MRVPLAVEIFSANLLPDPDFPGAVVAGNPEMRVKVVWESADKDQLRGIWEVAPGKFTWRFDVDEFFVVVSGRATVKGPDGQVFDMVPGSFVIFKPGDHTIWTVHETLRKGFHMAGLNQMPTTDESGPS
ncbi:hypothetical protein A5717_25295 [Mycolicibacterium porcinum]|nr:hypothetical protein A5717_25295 [Mycolicibacterium porcinum]